MKRIIEPFGDTLGFLKTSKSAILYTLLFFAILASAFYLAFSRGAVESLISQTGDRQGVVVETGSDSINHFIALVGDSLVVLANDSRIRNQTNIQSALDEFLDSWRETPTIGLFFADPEGSVLYITNNQSVGQNISDREYFSGAKDSKEGNFYVGEPVYTKFGTVEGEPVLPITTPVYSANGDFMGILLVAVYIEDFFKQYLDPIRITENTTVYLLDREGNFLFTPKKEDIGKNVFDFIENYPIPGKELIRDRAREVFDEGLEGTETIDQILPYSSEKDTQLKRVIVSYTPIALGNTTWILAIVTPVEDSLLFVTPYYVRQIVGFSVIFGAFLVISVRIAKIGGFREAVEENEGGKKR